MAHPRPRREAEPPRPKPEDPIAADFDALHVAARSAAYRDAVREIGSGLPDWIVPLSPLAADDLHRIVAGLHLTTGKLLVDLGCGSGGIGLWFAAQTSAAVVGVDFSPIAIAQANTLAHERGLEHRARFIVGDLTSTSLSDSSADAVVSVDSLMFCDASRAIEEIVRLLKPAGRVAIVAAEAIPEDAPAALPRDYRGLLGDAHLEVLEYEVLATYRARLLRLYHALNNRKQELRDQGGAGAQSLLAEAANGIARELDAPKVQEVLMVARRN